VPFRSTRGGPEPIDAQANVVPATRVSVGPGHRLLGPSEAEPEHADEVGRAHHQVPDATVDSCGMHLHEDLIVGDRRATKNGLLADPVMQPGYSFGESFEFGLDLIIGGLERAAASDSAGESMPS